MTTPTSTSRTRSIVLASVGLLAGVGITAGVVLGLGSASAAPAVPGEGTTTQVVVPSGTSSHHVTPVTPAAPSAAIETLQRELGQLNYYEGPVTGTMTGRTTQAVTYLQRDAHLPQTGTMNAATQAALAHFPPNGNNQMGG